MRKCTTAGADGIVERGGVNAGDVARLREGAGGNTPARRQNVERLFAIESACPARDAAWAAFFVETASAYYVDDIDPSGYLTRAKAGALSARISEDGLVATRTGLELLVTAIEKARWSPLSLVAFALSQVEHAVRYGTGPLRAALDLGRGAITDADVDLIRRLLCGFGGDDRLAVTRPETAVMFAIDAAAEGAQPNPAWTDLFVKVVANALMASSGYAVPTRRDALAPESWPNPWAAGKGRAFALDAAVLGSGRLMGRYRGEPPEERALARLARQRLEIITNEAVTCADAGWLAERLGARRRTASMNVLLDYLRDARPVLHPLLHDAVERRARAA